MPYNRVIAFGDSFTRGDELADCPEYKPDWSSKFKCEDTSESTWPALIAKSLNCDYECCAVGGRGNQWISWACNAYFTSDTLCIINWTWFERFDYFDVSVDDWRTTHPRHEDKLDHYFYRNLDSDIWNLHRNLQQIHSTISLLKQNNVNFIMTCLDNSYLSDLKDFRPGTQSNTVWTNAVSGLQEQVIPYIVDFEGMSFLEWSKHNSFELGPNGHPLEKAHAEAANYILDKCNKYLYNKRIE